MDLKIMTNNYVLHRFINARRRIVQPLIDQSNRAGAPGKKHLIDNKKLINFFSFFLPSSPLLMLTLVKVHQCKKANSATYDRSV